MTFLTNWVFWAIGIAIIVVLAIIGYLIEGTELDPDTKKEKPEPTKTPTPEPENIPSAWTGEITKDETHEQIHEVPSIDDWTTIPTDKINTETKETLEDTVVLNQPITPPEAQSTKETSEDIWK